MVLAWVARYARSYRLQGGSVLGKLNGSRGAFTEIVAYMADPVKFANLLSEKSPLGSALVNGDSYSFEFGTTLFTLRNSATGLPAVTNADWAHSPVQYDPVTHVLTDPLGTLGTAKQPDYTLKLVAKTRTLSQNFQALATGLIDSALYKLKQDTAFNTFRTSVLNSKTANANETTAVNKILLQNLAALAQVFPANSFGTILSSTLLSGSIAAQFNITSAQLTSRFTTLRSKVNRSYTDQALWLALLLPAQKAPKAGDLSLALGLPANDGLNALLSLDAMGEMRQLLNDPAFTAA